MLFVNCKLLIKNAAKIILLPHFSKQKDELFNNRPKFHYISLFRVSVFNYNEPQTVGIGLLLEPHVQLFP